MFHSLTTREFSHSLTLAFFPEHEVSIAAIRPIKIELQLI